MPYSLPTVSFENNWYRLKCNCSTTDEVEGSYITHKNCLDVLTLNGVAMIYLSCMTI